MRFYFKNFGTPAFYKAFLIEKYEEPVMLAETIINKMYLVRGQKMMVDTDQAALYGVATGQLNRTVKQNTGRFPDDFMFQLIAEEANLISQIGISSWGGRPTLLYAFTEQGIAMLSRILNSDTAIESTSGLSASLRGCARCY